MKPYGIPTDQLSQYRRSVHGIALLEKGNLKAPTCASCHSAHGAVPPQVSQISEVYGKCHLQTERYFRAGAHGAALAAEKKPSPDCIACHGNHGVQPASLELYQQSCAQCHPQNSSAQRQGEQLATLMRRAQEAVAGAEAELQGAKRLAFDVSIYRSRLTEATTYLTQARPAEHALALPQVEQLTRQARSIGEETQGDVHALLSSTGLRRVGLGLLWVFLVAAALISYLHKRQVRRR